MKQIMKQIMNQIMENILVGVYHLLKKYGASLLFVGLAALMIIISLILAAKPTDTAETIEIATALMPTVACYSRNLRRIKEQTSENKPNCSNPKIMNQIMENILVGVYNLLKKYEDSLLFVVLSALIIISLIIYLILAVIPTDTAQTTEIATALVPTVACYSGNPNLIKEQTSENIPNCSNPNFIKSEE